MRIESRKRKIQTRESVYIPNPLVLLSWHASPLKQIWSLRNQQSHENKFNISSFPHCLQTITFHLVQSSERGLPRTTHTHTHTTSFLGKSRFGPDSWDVPNQRGTNSERRSQAIQSSWINFQISSLAGDGWREKLLRGFPLNAPPATYQERWWSRVHSEPYSTHYSIHSPLSVKIFSGKNGKRI